MSVDVSYIIHRASEMVSLKDFASDTMDGDDFRKVFLMTQDAIRNLNQQTDVVFAYTSVVKQINGTELVFKPYTEDEQAIIDGGGTVDISNRIVTIRPVVCPAIYRGSEKLSIVEALDLPKYADGFTCAWNPDWDQDTIMFGKSISTEITVHIRKPITVPTIPSDELELPERYYDYIICLIAYNIASSLAMVETIPIVKANLDTARKLITRNNNYHRPVYLDTLMNRFG